MKQIGINLKQRLDCIAAPFTSAKTVNLSALSTIVEVDEIFSSIL
ncbi:MAG: hypothetical protein ACTS8H_02450 [Arsenophonus sp. NC-PE1-MAG3]